jgi:hypothetical protein
MSQCLRNVHFSSILLPYGMQQSYWIFLLGNVFFQKNPLKMSEFLKNKYFLMKNLLTIIYFLKKKTLSKENLLVLQEFLKNKYFDKGRPIIPMFLCKPKTNIIADSRLIFHLRSDMTFLCFLNIGQKLHTQFLKFLPPPLWLFNCSKKNLRIWTW